MSTPPFTPPPLYVIQSIGALGIVLGLLYRIPQIYRTYKQKSAIEISIWMIWLQNTSYLVYIVYGILQWDWIYIVSSCISIVQNMIILYMRSHYHKKSIKAIPLDQIIVDIVPAPTVPELGEPV